MRDHQLMLVLAGKITATDFDMLLPLEPDYLAVRGAACSADRTGQLDPRGAFAARSAPLAAFLTCFSAVKKAQKSRRPADATTAAKFLDTPAAGSILGREGFGRRDWPGRRIVTVGSGQMAAGSVNSSFELLLRYLFSHRSGQLQFRKTWGAVSCRVPF